jgi:hypothetical protein
MAKKSITYDLAQKYVKDKDTAINSFIETSLDKTQQIFAYDSLPETIPQEELENILQTKGHCIIAEVDGKLYALSGGFSGEVDEYNNPTQYTVSNVALKLSKTFTIGVDCILIKNDYHKSGMLPILQKYGVLLVDSEISLNTASILSRITMLISAPDDKTKASADLFIQKILNGDFSVIGENGFFDGVKLQTASTTNSNYITQLIELIQYYKASFLNEIGLQANYNMKRERLSESEILLNVDNLLPLIENMYSERKKAVEKVNKMFGTEIVVDYNGVWKTTHEHADKEEVATDTVTEDELETVETETETTETDETDETAVETEETETETEETEETETETDETETETKETDETEETDETGEETTVEDETEVEEDEKKKTS